MTSDFPSGHQDLGHAVHLIDIGLYRPRLGGCYLIGGDDQFALIDCGTGHSVPQVLQTLAAQGGRPEQVRWIIPTHIHLDHAGGAGRLMQLCPNATLVVHPRGLAHMIDPSRLQAGAIAVYGEQAFERDFGSLLPVPEDRCIAAGDHQVFELGERRLRFVHTPGHANHHGCILDSRSGYLFTGDTFGLAYQEFATPSPYLIATTSPVAFDPQAWMDSLERLLALDPEAVCLTHYGLYTDPAGLAPMLRASIQAHAEIALAEEENPEPGRGDRLRAAVDNLLVSGAVVHCGIPAQDARELLAADIELNAQGLEIWLARRARHRAQA